MSTLAMILFGSAARGDSVSTSDIDILAVSSDGDVKSSRVFGKIEIQHMPLGELTRMAEAGDLFAIHLAYEGKLIFETDSIFSHLKESLRIRDSYSRERMFALELGWFLVHHGSAQSNQRLVNKRIAWCVRTVLISLAVEDGRFLFSPSSLKSRSTFRDTAELIDLRRSKVAGKRKYSTLSKFIRHYSDATPLTGSVGMFSKRFAASGNEVAVSTVKKLVEDIDSSSGYPEKP